MNRYLVKLMFHINIDHGSHASQFDEQVRLVNARSMEDAFQKARIIGKKEEESFTNAENQLVQWQFIDVADVCSLDNIPDGEQIYSNTHENTDHRFFIDYIRQKAMLIQAKTLTFV